MDVQTVTTLITTVGLPTGLCIILIMAIYKAVKYFIELLSGQIVDLNSSMDKLTHQLSITEEDIAGLESRLYALNESINNYIDGVEK